MSRRRHAYRYVSAEEKKKKQDEEAAAFAAFVETLRPGLLPGESLSFASGYYRPLVNLDAEGEPESLRVDLTHIGANPFLRLHTTWHSTDCPRIALKTATAERVLAEWRAHRKNLADGRALRIATAASDAENKAAGLAELGFAPFSQYDSDHAPERDALKLDAVIPQRMENGTLRYHVKVREAKLTADQVKRLVALLQETPA